MGGAGAALTPQESVRGLIEVLDRLKRSDTSRLFDQRGGRVAW